MKIYPDADIFTLFHARGSVSPAIERHQPLLGLHGHIHESRGLAKVGRTTVFNPGSEYSDGVLRGLIVTVEAGKGIRGHQFVAG